MKEKEILKGIHHITAITSDAEEIYQFFTYILGMRLVKKNVNQDDLRTYHLFFADDRGNPGTDMTFFDFKDIALHQRGNEDISRSSFRVPSDEALRYWIKRFDHYDVEHSDIVTHFAKKMIYFEDFDKQRYALVSDENNHGVAAGEAWHKGPVPDEYAITGLGPVFLTLSNDALIQRVLVEVLGMRKIAQEAKLTLYEMGNGGNGASVIVGHSENEKIARQGHGGVHHVAFRVEDKAVLEQWIALFNRLGIANSGYVDRFYFKSLYVRLYPNILFELATDGPGFIDDQESYEVLGETLTLPPHLRDKSDYVKRHLEDFDTKRSDQHFTKEYF